MALGANLGDPRATLNEAVRSLERLGTVERRSRPFRTAPVGGPPGQDDYLNAVILMRPKAPYAEGRALLAALLEIEAAFGRERRRRWAARTLDLDLLALGDAQVDEPGLTLPHPRMMERAFVLAPLLDVAPEWRHPGTGTTAREAFDRMSAAGVRPAEFDWDER